MRLFIGLPVDTKYVNPLKELSQGFPELQQSLIHPENLHLTLIPPWETQSPEKDMEFFSSIKIVDSNLSIDFTAFERRGRIFWIKGEKTNELQTFVQTIYSHYNYFSKKVFLPHITIARLYKSEEANAKKVQINEKITLNMKFNSVALYRSHLSSKGSNYTILKVFSLNS